MAAAATGGERKAVRAMIPKMQYTRGFFAMIVSRNPDIGIQMMKL
jgi:hypothetical protein